VGYFSGNGIATTIVELIALTYGYNHVGYPRKVAARYFFLRQRKN